MLLRINLEYIYTRGPVSYIGYYRYRGLKKRCLVTTRILK